MPDGSGMVFGPGDGDGPVTRRDAADPRPGLLRGFALGSITVAGLVIAATNLVPPRGAPPQRTAAVHPVAPTPPPPPPQARDSWVAPDVADLGPLKQPVGPVALPNVQRPVGQPPEGNRSTRATRGTY